MDKENLYVVTQCFFNYHENITVNMPGDIPDTSRIERFEPYNTCLIGIYSDKAMADEYLKEKHLNNESSWGEDDGWGTDYHFSVNGYYHTVEEKELDTIVIQGQKYANIDGSFLAINRGVKTMDLEKQHKNPDSELAN